MDRPDLLGEDPGRHACGLDLGSNRCRDRARRHRIDQHDRSGQECVGPDDHSRAPAALLVADPLRQSELADVTTGPGALRSSRRHRPSRHDRRLRRPAAVPVSEYHTLVEDVRLRRSVRCEWPRSGGVRTTRGARAPVAHRRAARRTISPRPRRSTKRQTSAGDPELEVGHEAGVAEEADDPSLIEIEHQRIVVLIDDERDHAVVARSGASHGAVVTRDRQRLGRVGQDEWRCLGPTLPTSTV